MLHERCVHIVDDEAKVRDALTLLLSTAQIKSKSYGSAEEYLTLNPLKEPACVLLDNQLPGMSGIELLRRIVAATGKSTVIMITAYGDVPTAVLAMKAGAFDFVQKPFDAEALLASVEEALSLGDDGRDAPHEMKEFKARLALLTQREREVLALASRGIADQAHRSPAGHQLEDGRTPQGRRHSEDARAQYFPSHANGVRREKCERRRARREIGACRSRSLFWWNCASALQSERAASRMDGETFDYVIVGAGSAGCVLADRLTEDGRSSVLVLEYGGSDRSIFIQMPAALSIPMNSKTYNWGYESEPEPHLGGRRIACPRGKVLGGSSSINGMVYVRGHPLDFERWEEEGAKGWGYRNVLPYFRRAESFRGRRRRLSRRRRTARDRARAANATRSTTPSSRRAGRRAMRSAPTSTASGRRGSAPST